MHRLCNTCGIPETEDNWVVCKGKSRGGRCRKCFNAANKIASKKYKQKPEVKAKHVLQMRSYRASLIGKLRVTAAFNKYVSTIEGRRRVNNSALVWARNNPEKSLARNMLRHARKLQRTPKWLSQEDLKLIEAKYAMAKWLSEVVGVPYHVDHIIPLRSKKVSGLHIPDNLQVITAKQNLVKGNTYV